MHSNTLYCRRFVAIPRLEPLNPSCKHLLSLLFSFVCVWLQCVLGSQLTSPFSLSFPLPPKTSSGILTSSCQMPSHPPLLHNFVARFSRYSSLFLRLYLLQTVCYRHVQRTHNIETARHLYLKRSQPQPPVGLINLCAFAFERWARR